MNKNTRLLTLTVLLFLTVVSYGQQIKVTYGVENSTDFDKENREILEKYPSAAAVQKMLDSRAKAIMEAAKATYSLEISDSLSYFYMNELMLNDALGKDVIESAKVYANKGEFYQNTVSKKVWERTTDKQTVIEYSFDFFDWQLSAETENILGYTCYKATSTYTEPHPAGGKAMVRNITVWYTPDIPLNFGPQGYGGLPGLILKKCHSNTCFTAEKIEDTKTKIRLPKEKPISREEVYERYKKINVLGF